MRRFGLLALLARQRAAHAEAQADALGPGATAAPAPDAHFVLPAGCTVERELAYGSDPAQRLDVYRPSSTHAAPLMLFVHGGGWRQGDKSLRRMVEHKVGFWVGQGWVFLSINYRMLPLADPLQQAIDLARALAFAQANAARWGADPARVVLLGHSAGAHLAALLTADAGLGAEVGLQPWVASLLLDTAALDVVSIMQRPHFRLYDPAFGSDPEFWRATSPLHRLSHRPGAATLLVYSSLRGDSEAPSRAFATKAGALGGRVELLGLPLSHRQLNDELGQPGHYTDAVDTFLRAIVGDGQAPPRARETPP